MNSKLAFVDFLDDGAPLLVPRLRLVGEWVAVCGAEGTGENF